MGEQPGNGAAIDDVALGADELDHALRSARATEYRAQFVTGPLGIVGSALTFVALTWSVFDRQLLIAWIGGMLTVAVGLLAVQLPASWRWVGRDGVPVAGQIVHVLAGLGWGLALWFPLASGRADRASVWIPITLAIAVTGGASAGLSGANTLGRNVVVALWSVGLPALLANGEITMAIAGAVFTALMLLQIYNSRVSWEELVRVQTLWQHQAERRRREAGCDSLTGLRNHAGLREDVAGLSTPATHGVVFIDLDGFKAVNDRWGHHVGDAVLVQVGERLVAHSPDGSIVARPGGDEFVIVVADVTDDDVRALDRRLAAAIEAPIDGVVAEPIRVGVSSGVAWHGDGALDLAALMRRADSAQYAAKRAKRRARPADRTTDPVPPASPRLDLAV